MRQETGSEQTTSKVLCTRQGGLGKFLGTIAKKPTCLGRLGFEQCLWVGKSWKRNTYGTQWKLVARRGARQSPLYVQNLNRFFHLRVRRVSLCICFTPPVNEESLGGQMEVQKESEKDTSPTLLEVIAIDTRKAEDVCNRFWQVLAETKVLPGQALLATMLLQDAIKISAGSEQFSTAKAWAKYMHTYLDIKPVPNAERPTES